MKLIEYLFSNKIRKDLYTTEYGIELVISTWKTKQTNEQTRPHHYFLKGKQNVGIKGNKYKLHDLGTDGYDGTMSERQEAEDGVNGEGRRL